MSLRGITVVKPAQHFVVSLVLPALLVAFILITLDWHELLISQSRCSVCQVKNVLSGSAEKSVVTDVSISGQTWRLTPSVIAERRASEDLSFRFQNAVSALGGQRAPPV
jgi:hypothetical protein